MKRGDNLVPFLLVCQLQQIVAVIAELREYAERRGWQIVEEFTDQGVSGCRESRPALNRLMSDASRRRFDAILVWKIDRFGRSLKHLVNSLAELAALGVAFISLRDNIDLSTPTSLAPLVSQQPRLVTSRNALMRVLAVTLKRDTSH